MAGTQINFPAITPSSRTYKPGSLPRTEFRAQNGNTNYVQFGVIFTDAELKVQFKNISDEQALQILEHYQSVTGDDWVHIGGFPTTGILAGMDQSLYANIDKGARGRLHWRYAGPPTITSVYPGISTVSCDFIGSLEVQPV